LKIEDLDINEDQIRLLSFPYKDLYEFDKNLALLWFYSINLFDKIFLQKELKPTEIKEESKKEPKWNILEKYLNYSADKENNKVYYSQQFVYK